MACGRIALERCGFDIEKYYASEIDKYSIEVAKANYPDIIHIGDVCNVTAEDYQDIDLLMGGSPCQGFSFAGKKLNFDDQRSALFFEFVRILQEVRPKYFLLENVRMKKEYQDIITEHLGVEPIMINSALVSAQNRVRLYWTNIPNVEQPEDRGIILRDVLETNHGELPVKDTERNRRHVKLPDEKSLCCAATMYKGAGNNGMTLTPTVYEYVEHPNYYQFDVSGKGYNSQQDRIRKTEAKSNTLAAGHASIPKVVVGAALRARSKNRDGKRVEWKTEKPQQSLELRKDEKANSLSSVYKDSLLSDGISYRKLTPVECERLQTIPDNYTNYVSNTQRYKMIGNGWTVEVIRHIFKNMKPPTNKVTSDRKNLNTSLIVR